MHIRLCHVASGSHDFYVRLKLIVSDWWYWLPSTVVFQYHTLLGYINQSEKFEPRKKRASGNYHKLTVISQFMLA